MDRSEADAQAVQEKAYRRLVIARLPLVVWATFSVACATYQTELQGSIEMIRAGKPAQAAEKLKEKATAESDDQVVYLLEYGTALQLAGDYRSSVNAFLKAEDLTAIKDYHSLSRVTGSLLLNEGMVQYKGEDYEKVLINAMLAINFLAMNDLDAALVETRKVNDKLYKYKFEAKRDYEQNPFAFYLAAMIWEANRQWDDAYIDYKKVYEIDPTIPYLQKDLIRSARLARRADEVEKWKKTFNVSKAEFDKSKGEIILLFQQGWAPRKYPNPESPRFPKLFPVSSTTRAAKLVVDGVGEEYTQTISSVKDVAMKTLGDQYAALVAKRVAGVAAKAVVADQVRQKNEVLGHLAWIGMNLADRADLRQWVTLPESFQVARLAVHPGKYKVRIEGIGFSGQPTGELLEDLEIKVEAGGKVFIPWRSLR